MPSNDREVFQHVQSKDETELASDFMTYAVFAGEKQQWMELWESKHQRPPTQDEIDNWISNLTDSQFTAMRASADVFLGTVIEDYTKERIEAERVDILRNAIVREVRSAGVWWRQLAIALITAILAPLIIGAVLAAGFYFSHLPTPADVAKGLEGPTPPAR